MSGQGPGNVARTVLTILLYRMNKTDAVCFSNLKKNGPMETVKNESKLACQMTNRKLCTLLFSFEKTKTKYRINKLKLCKAKSNLKGKKQTTNDEKQSDAIC